MAKKNWRRPALQDILARRPDGYLVANKYKVIIGMLRRRYPELDSLDRSRLEDIVFDAVNGNRDWQMLTEGHDQEAKRRLEQEWKMGEGYHDLPPSVANTPPRGT